MDPLGKVSEGLRFRSRRGVGERLQAHGMGRDIWGLGLRVLCLGFRDEC